MTVSRQRKYEHLKYNGDIINKRHNHVGKRKRILRQFVFIYSKSNIIIINIYQHINKHIVMMMIGYIVYMYIMVQHKKHTYISIHN